MTPSAITLAVFLVALALFVADFLPMGLVVFMVPMALYFCGIIEVKEIFAPLVGQSIVLVVAMSVIGAALFKTGMAERIGKVLFRFCPGERSLMLAVTLFSGVVSAFVSNTGTVAILIPIIMGAAASHGIRPSRLLIPLTAGATLGGNISVIGSPGNLIAKETIEKFSEGAMGVRFFEYAGVGVPLLVAAAVFFAIVGPKLVPAKGGDSQAAQRGGVAKGAALSAWQGWFTVAVLLLSVGAMIGADYFKWLPPMHITACVGAIAVVLFGVLTQKEAFAAFDMQAVFLLSFMTPLGGAMIKTGAAQKIADAVVGVGGGHGPLVMMAVLWLTVWGLTQVMSNTATCALFCPIGWTIAKTLGADPRAVVIAILIASSVAVCTPLAIPANSMILEPGGLRFKDFFRPGICLSALAFVLSMVLLPILYPFYPAACLHSAPSVEESCDVVVYGSSPAAISAAIQAKRMGRSVVVVSPETRIGGLTTGGLGQTDIGNKAVFGGIALEFYRAVAAYYADGANWTRQKPESYFPDGQCAGSKGKDSMWTFEPSAALKILEGWERRYGLDIRRDEWLDRENGVEKENGRIVSIKTLSGNVYRGKVFVDATYEGDFMAAAGVSYVVGREANAAYGETLNGNQPAQARFHQLNAGVDPYVVKGDPRSGLLFGVEPYDPAIKPGDGDRRVQAYCFRMCLTDDPENRIPFKKPDGYDERDYELLFRHLAAAPLDGSGIPWINSKMPNRKTDTNNRSGFSTDFIGGNWAWPEATYEEREKMLAEHLKYQRGLMWTLANHPRVPEKIRNEVSKWGTCRDEFVDGLGDGWQTQLYVREARRMVGEYVMTEHNCWGRRVAPKPVAMGAYTMDSHHVRRYVGADGFVHNEGDVEVGVDAATGKRFKPYPIDYGAVLPRRGECGNLAVPVCLSASHIAFGSIRMEPVFFALGQVAGTAASIAVARDVELHDVPYGELASRLEADGQVLRAPAPVQRR